MDLDWLDKSKEDLTPSPLDKMIMMDEILEEIKKKTTVQQIVIIARFLGCNYHEIGLLLGIDSHKGGRPKKLDK